MFRASLRTSSRLTASVLRSSPATTALVGRRLLSDQARTQIQKAIEGSPVVMFMKGTPQLPECGFSRAATQVLEISGVPPEKLKTYNVLQDDELRQGIKEFSEWPTIPQVYVNGEFVGGCDILLSMFQSGELATLLESKGIVPKAEEKDSEESPQSA